MLTEQYFLEYIKAMNNLYKIDYVKIFGQFTLSFIKQDVFEFLILLLDAALEHIPQHIPHNTTLLEGPEVDTIDNQFVEEVELLFLWALTDILLLIFDPVTKFLPL